MRNQTPTCFTTSERLARALLVESEPRYHIGKPYSLIPVLILIDVCFMNGSTLKI